MDYDHKILSFWQNHAINYTIPNTGQEFPEGWDVRNFLIETIRSEKIVEIGCGYGRLCGKFSPQQYFGYDISSKSIDMAKQKYPDYSFEICDPTQDSLNITDSQWLLFYTVLLHVNDKDIEKFIKISSAKTNKILVGEIMGRKWRNKSNKPPVFNRSAKEYIQIFAKLGFEHKQTTLKPYHRYGSEVSITFLEFHRTLPSNEIKFVCVHKESPTYTQIYVDKLINGIMSYNTQNLKMCCITSNVQQHRPLSYEPINMLFDWPGWWSKLELFRPDINGNIFYCDLDTIIRGNIDIILEICKQHNNPILLTDFFHSKQLASGVMWLPEKYRKLVWESWTQNCSQHMINYKKAGDQGFISSIIGSSASRWQNILPKNSIVSLKVHCKNTTPKESAIICYHGRPRPHQNNWSETLIIN